jgi:hypothetical protein
MLLASNPFLGEPLPFPYGPVSDESIQLNVL